MAAEWKPDLLIEFSPDRFNVFFEGPVPRSFVGVATNHVGDVDSPAGRIVVDRYALERHESRLESGIDDAMFHSIQILVDHGSTQTPNSL